MPVIITALFLVLALGYVFAVTFEPLLARFLGIEVSSRFASHALTVHGVFFALSVFACVIAFSSIFRYRNKDFMIGSKRSLLTMAIIAFASALYLGYLIVQLVRP